MEIESLSCVLHCVWTQKHEKVTQSPLHTWCQPTNPLVCKQKEKKYPFPHLKQLPKIYGYQEDVVLAWNMTKIQRVLIGLKIYIHHVL